MRDVAGQFVLESQFLFLEAVEKVFVGVGSVLFFLDEGVKSRMLRLQFLDHCLIHWCRSFHSACHHRVINHESALLSRPLSRLGGSGVLLAVNGPKVPAGGEMR